MDAYKAIEHLMARKYKQDMTTRKATGDFMLAPNHAVNVKSNNLDKQNYSPNMISIQKLHKWVFEERKELSFIFVDYREVAGDLQIVAETEPIPIHHISWQCLSIEAQGYGVIQKVRPLILDTRQTKSEFYKGFLTEYEKFREKERKKHEAFAKRFVDPVGIVW
jgi:hypothetical protein